MISRPTVDNLKPLQLDATFALEDGELSVLQEMVDARDDHLRSSDFITDHGKDSRQILTQALGRADISILEVAATGFPISAVH